jgi:hypothetical protein
LLFMPPCGPHLTLLATGSLERSLLVFSTPGGLTGNDRSRLFSTCTNTSQAATCTCNTWPRISPHNVVNHSSHKEVTIHRSLNHTWSSPLPKGPETCLLQVILLFAFPLAFNHLLKFLSVVSFLFLFSLVTKTCVLSMNSSKGKLRAPCG